MYLNVVYVFIISFACLNHNTGADEKAANASNSDVKVNPETQWCLGCICEAISNCNISQSFCEGDVCGIFRITWAYWADAGKPVINGEDPNSNAAYAHCTTDPKCAGRAVSGYMKRYSQDCNGDGIIDCYDYAAIHRFGGYGCHQPLTGPYGDKFKTCLARITMLQ